MNEFPITLDEFKSFFLRETGVEYQPYPSWVKTVFDSGEYATVGTVYYQSLIDMNITDPTEETEEPTWQQLTYDYVAGEDYAEGTIVFYIDRYFRRTAVPAAEGVDISPSNGRYWNVVSATTLFPNSRVWVAPIAYNEGSKVIRVVNYKVGVWESQMNDNYFDPAINPDIPDQTPAVSSWVESEEDTEELGDYILDWDILRAMGEAMFKFNRSLFAKERGKMVFLYLTMFFLVNDRQAGAQGTSSSTAAGPVVHRTVGKMSVSYAESKLFKNYPSYEFLGSNAYGRKAFNLIMPYLRGNVQLMHGGSTGE